MQPEVGAIYEGKVTGITKFGAFVSIPGGKSGLVHISEIANAYVSDVAEYLQVGQDVKVKVIGVNDEGKIKLSIKQTEERPAPAPRRAPQQSQSPRLQQSQPSAFRPQRAPAAAQPGEVYGKSDDMGFESKLKQFMQESESKISGSRQYENQKKGSRRRR